MSYVPYLATHRYRITRQGQQGRFRLTWWDHLKDFFIRWYYWEYWNPHLLYLPVYLYGLIQVIRARSFFLFVAVNPRIPYGGMLADPKHEIDNLLPSAHTPKTLFFKHPCTYAQIITSMRKQGIDFPIMLKPDLGRRGAHVQQINTKEEIKTYLSNVSRDIILQPYVDYPLELGIFYYRFPNTQQSTLSSMVIKAPLHVVGSGHHTVGELMRGAHRTHHYLFVLHKRNPSLLSYIPAPGEVVYVTNLGNHCQGTVFLDAREYITPRLVQFFDTLSSEIPGFYYGRFDVRCRSLEDLMQGQCIKILELNGVSAEVTHIYHPYRSLLSAYRDIFAHVHIMYKIACMNRDKVHLRSKEKRYFFQQLWQVLRDD